MSVMILMRSAAQAQNDCLDDLAALLMDVVHSGASVGFLPPLPVDDARAGWQRVIYEVTAGVRRLLATLHDGRALRTVQLGPVQNPNGPHRAEGQKLRAHIHFRRQGIGRPLITAVEAQQQRRTLLLLDALKGGAAEQLHPALGCVRLRDIPDDGILPDGRFAVTVIFCKRLYA